MDARASRYRDVYTHCQRSPEVFWAEAVAEIDWYEKPKRIFDKDAGIYGRWFTVPADLHLRVERARDIDFDQMPLRVSAIML